MEKNADAQTTKLELLGYSGYKCSNCGRLRVEKWIVHGKLKHVCEKCNWCEEDKMYIDWDSLDE